MTALRGVSCLALVLAVASNVTSAALACDACLEDKIAATYDWQVVSAAKARGHTVVFSAIRGPITPGDAALKERLSRSLSAVGGVDAGSVRVSVSPPAVSFACDLGRTSAARLLSIMNQRIHGSGLQLVLVRVGAPGGPAAAGVSLRADPSRAASR